MENEETASEKNIHRARQSLWRIGSIARAAGVMAQESDKTGTPIDIDNLMEVVAELSESVEGCIETMETEIQAAKAVQHG